MTKFIDSPFVEEVKKLRIVYLIMDGTSATVVMLAIEFYLKN
ncbi:hypothetical protein C5L17_001615 [Latilactobacillus sakei subsp. sakei]|nr:hypothetical protein C5L17_001615 [Latilactobacillus sakei subsp. sakei]BAX65854.1 hypothetical protein LACBS_00392 [Latilactobacillus sakei subsp. sakei DSM 20017 = JCM 1157]